MSHETNLTVRRAELEQARKALGKMPSGGERKKQLNLIARLELEILTLEALQAEVAP